MSYSSRSLAPIIFSSSSESDKKWRSGTPAFLLSTMLLCLKMILSCPQKYYTRIFTSFPRYLYKNNLRTYIQQLSLQFIFCQKLRHVSFLSKREKNGPRFSSSEIGKLSTTGCVWKGFFFCWQTAILKQSVQKELTFSHAKYMMGWTYWKSNFFMDFK